MDTKQRFLDCKKIHKVQEKLRYTAQLETEHSVLKSLLLHLEDQMNNDTFPECVGRDQGELIKAYYSSLATSCKLMELRIDNIKIA